MYYKDRNGVRVLYQERDMQYDVAHAGAFAERGREPDGEDGCAT